eukprot:8474687-Heterocapsa_arctica.AAC.1
MEDEDNARTKPRTISFQSNKGNSSGHYLRPKEHTSVSPIPTGLNYPEGMPSIPGKSIPNSSGAANPDKTIRGALGVPI